MDALESYYILEKILGEPSFSSQSAANRFSFNCPHCALENGGDVDNKYNLEVNLNKQVYHCWKCMDHAGTKGTLYKLIRNYGSKNDLIEYINKFSNFIPQKKDDFTHKTNVSLPDTWRMVYKRENVDAYNYLVKRGLDNDTINFFRFGWDSFDKNTIYVPSYNMNGDLNYIMNIFYKSRRIKYKIKRNYNFEGFFFEDRVNYKETVYLTEGLFDAISLPNGIPLLGKNLTVNHTNRIFNYKPKRIVLCLDRDVTLKEIENKILMQLDILDCNIFILKNPYKDINEALMRRGYQYIGNLINTSLEKVK